MKKLLSLILVTVMLAASCGLTAFAYTGHVNDGDTLSFSGATSSNAFGDLIDWTGIVFGNASNIIDVEGTLAVGGSFDSGRGLSVNNGAYGASPAAADNVAFLVNGNVSINGYGNVCGQTVVGSANGNTYRLSNLTASGAANGQYTVADSSKYFADAKSAAYAVKSAVEALPVNGVCGSENGTYTFAGDPSADVLVYNVDEPISTGYLFDFNIADGQTVVVNLTSSDKIEFKYGAVRINGNMEPEYLRGFNRNIIINVVRASEITMTSCELYGILLAPDAVLTGSNASVCGTSILNGLTGLNGFELHTGYNNSFIPAVPAYSGITPVKPQDTDYSYEFSGWSPVISAVTGDATYTAQYNSVPRPFYASHSLTLNGDIGVNFYVDVTTISGVDVSDVTSGNKVVTLDFKWYDKHSTYRIKPSDYDAQKGLFKATCNVAAAEMMYPITATVYVKNSGASGIGTLQNGQKFSEQYRVRDYADVILDPTSSFSVKYAAEHPQDYADLVALVKKMLDYGAKAQVVFNRFKDKNGATILAANSGVDYTMTPHEITGNAPDMETGLEEYGLEYAGSTLVLLTTTNMLHYYLVRDNAKYEAVKDSVYYVAPDGDHIQAEPQNNGSYIFFEIPNIAAAELDRPQVLNIGGQNYSYSVIQFAQKMQTANRPGEYDLASALYWYNAAAKDYFNIQ